MNKKLGIIGGMGPLATADFYRRIVELTPASCDQEHIETYILSVPGIPRRVEYIMGEGGEDPGPVLRELAQKLEAMGVDVIAIPCVTAHFFYDEICEGLGVPVLSMVTETVRQLKEKKIGRVGLLGTRATIECGILQQGLVKDGIEAVLPDSGEEDIISKIIFEEIKQGREADREKLFWVMDRMMERGADKCLIACTDLSAGLGNNKRVSTDGDMESVQRGKYIDLMDVLALAAVRNCCK